jgi:uncharacterized protein (DUF1015 family)
MAKIFPFQPYRYSDRAGPLDRLVTQPYDKISPEMQAGYLTSSPYNLVRIILGERLPTDTDADNVYTRAARYLKEWIDAGILVREDEPALFAYFQKFHLPDTGETLVRKGFIGLGAVEDYSAGVVHRHEQTLSGPKQDRLDLLRHTRAHFGQIFMLYPDPKREIDSLLDQVSGGEPATAVTDEYGTEHMLWKIAASERIEFIRQRMADKKLLIADGHHRYETALAFRDEHPGLEDAQKVMMTFVNIDSPGLRILPTHRLVRNADPEGFLRAAQASFRVEEFPSLEAMQKAWTEPRVGKIRIGLALAGLSSLYLVEAERRDRLDIVFLHAEILEKMLGIGEEAVRQEKNLGYVRGAGAALEAVRSGECSIAFLLEPVSVADVAGIAFSGGVMPQKSTDFYPKLLSGLTIYKLER